LKYGNSYYLQLTREIFNEKYSGLSVTAKWLFVVLNELEQRYTGQNEDFFFRTNEELAVDCGISLATLKRAKKELLETDLIESWKGHCRDPETGKFTEKQFTFYRILR
jgi:hypothetical protein